MRTNGHEVSCLCEWCCALMRSARYDRITGGLKHPELLGYHRLEQVPLPPEKSDPRVIRLRSQMPQVKGDAYPLYELVVETVDRFNPVTKRRPPKTSGCWYCIGEPEHDELCDMCVNLLSDYRSALK